MSKLTKLLETVFDDDKKLASDIITFLDKYAKLDASEPTEYSSPDACMMKAYAHGLLTGIKNPLKPWSSWSSGGYGPYSSTEGKKLHDELIKRINQRVVK